MGNNTTSMPAADSGERFADIQLLRYRLDGFAELTLRQKLYAYYLSEAALWGRDITFDQFGEHNLLLRKTLEKIYCSGPADYDPADYAALETYLKRVWFSNGAHHHYSSDKFAPGFSKAFFEKAVRSLGHSGQISDPEEVLEKLCPLVFVPDFMPKRTNKAAGADLVATSACNYYGPGVSQAEAEGFYARKAEQNPGCGQSWGLNTKLVKRDGLLEEEVWNEAGKYGPAIRRIVHWLEKAASVAENDRQRKAIALLLEYYRTGDLGTFDSYSIEWTGETEGVVDFVNGFIEVYSDPLETKGSWEALVDYTDREATARTKAISQNAQWFEDNSPVDPQFKRKGVKGVTAKAVRAAMLAGDEYPSSAIGINLPNANWIRERHGSKSVTITNLTQAYKEAARGSGFDKEFATDQATIGLLEKYGDLTDDVHTDLHECLGHGSGQMAPGVGADALKSYGNVIEEARADLFGLYYMADRKLVELGVLPDTEAYKAQYYRYLLNGALTQLARIEPGKTIEEAHMRNRALIARWALRHSDGAAKLVEKGGKTYLEISDYGKLRAVFAELLREIQRIKSEGDLAAARRMVEEYAVEVDGRLHAEVRERYGKLGIAPYKGFINPVLRPVEDGCGNITDIEVDYTESYTGQMLRYGRQYGAL